MDKTFITKVKIKDQGNDFSFWQTKSYKGKIGNNRENQTGIQFMEIC